MKYLWIIFLSIPLLVLSLMTLMGLYTIVTGSFVEGLFFVVLFGSMAAYLLRFLARLGIKKTDDNEFNEETLRGLFEVFRRNEQGISAEPAPAISKSRGEEWGNPPDKDGWWGNDCVGGHHSIYVCKKCGQAGCSYGGCRGQKFYDLSEHCMVCGNTGSRPLPSSIFS